MAEPTRRSWASIVRTVFGTGAVLLLLACLAGIVISGPIVVRVPPFDPRVAASPERLRDSVTRLCEDFAPRDASHPENLDRAAAWIASELRAAGFEVAFQDYTIDVGRFRNVVGRIQGSDPTVGALVLGAHYDALPGTPGADDNASGVAILLELARTLPQATVRGTRYFVAFATAELGGERTGSHHFAESLVARDEAVELVVALDTVGYYDDTPRSQLLPLAPLALLYPDAGDFVAVVGDHRSGQAIRRVRAAMLATDKLDVYSFRAPPALAPVDLTDPTPFRRHGMPAVQITDTADLRNPHYHEPGDRPETLDYARMALLVQALHGVLWDPEAPPIGAAEREPQ